MSGAPVVLARFTPNRGILLGMFLGLVMFTVAAAGTLLTVDPEELRQGPPFGRQALWVALVACPVFAADMLARLIRRTPNLVATKEGLVLRSILGFTPPIPWHRIAGFSPVVIGKKAFLGIYLDDPPETLAGLGTVKGSRSLVGGTRSVFPRSSCAIAWDRNITTRWNWATLYVPFVGCAARQANIAFRRIESASWVFPPEAISLRALRRCSTRAHLPRKTH